MRLLLLLLLQAISGHINFDSLCCTCWQPWRQDSICSPSSLWLLFLITGWTSSSSSYVALQLFYRVLAFSPNSLHLPLSWARVFQFGVFNFCISFLTSFTQCVFGLLEMGFQEYIAFTILVPCILSMWPSQLSLCARMKFVIYLCFIISSSSWLVYILPL